MAVEIKFSEDGTGLHKIAKEYLELLLGGNRHLASQLILNAVENKTSIKEIYLSVFQRSQLEIGRLWQTNQISVSQEHYCTAATQLIMSQLYPYVFKSEKIGKKLVATCVSEELHEVGIRMVSDFFEMEGWDTYYLGANSPVKDLITTLEQESADVLAISTTITFNINSLTNMICEIRKSKVGKEIPIVVGGRPFNISKNLWQKVKADGFAADAEAAIHEVNSLI